MGAIAISIPPKKALPAHLHGALMAQRIINALIQVTALIHDVGMIAIQHLQIRARCVGPIARPDTSAEDAHVSGACRPRHGTRPVERVLGERRPCVLDVAAQGLLEHRRVVVVRVCAEHESDFG